MKVLLFNLRARNAGAFVCLFSLFFCFVGLPLKAQSSTSKKKALASQTAIVPCKTASDLDELAIPAEWFKESCKGGKVISVAEKTSQAGVRYVDVKGIIRPVDPDAPNIEWEIALPLKWNGRSLQLGGGANNGSIPNVHGTSAFGSIIPVDAGYVVYGDDSGHQSDNGMDASFASNEESLNNYIRLHLIKAQDAMRYVVNYFYGQEPVFNYFAGCSTGGREALECATTYGKYYDGVFCAQPASNYVLARLWGAILSQAVYESYDEDTYPHSDGFIDEKTVESIQQDAIALYDKWDGIEDGIVCNIFAARQNKDNFLKAIQKKYQLTDAQLKTIDVYENGYELNYKMKNGMNCYKGYSALEGGRMDLGPSEIPREPLDTRYNVHHGDRADGIFKYFFTKDPTWKLIAHDYFNPDEKLYRILMDASERYDANAPDFDDFLAHGGKLILFSGWMDMSMSPWQLIEQYKGYVAKYGQEKTDSFCKFYIMPDATHGNGVTMNYLDWLDRWCTTGIYPQETLYGTMQKTQGQMPMAEYPGWIKYIGGDPKSGTSYQVMNENNK